MCTADKGSELVLSSELRLFLFYLTQTNTTKKKCYDMKGSLYNASFITIMLIRARSRNDEHVIYMPEWSALP